MKKFQERMQGVLPPEELPSFFNALESLGKSPRKSLRIRRDLSPEAALKWTPEKFREFGIPMEQEVSWYPHGYFFDLKAMAPHPSRHAALAAGLVFIQEAGAMEVVPALEIEENHLVLDLCAAPGAKATHIGEYLGRNGWLVANELVRDRAKLLDVILARHGIGNSTVFNLEPHRLAKVFPGVFDRILIDAPCSGESLFAKRNEKRADVTDKEVGRCALRQRAILESGWAMLAPGGRVVYSTCAYSMTENETLIADFLSAHPEAKLFREQRRFPHRDEVPGGYFAVIEKNAKDGEATFSSDDRRAGLREGIREIGSRGLVREGLLRWNGETDPYAELMNRKGEARSGGPAITELNLAEAAEFLLGEPGRKFPKDLSVIYSWEGERIAGSSEGTLHYPRGRLR